MQHMVLNGMRGLAPAKTTAPAAADEEKKEALEPDKGNRNGQKDDDDDGFVHPYGDNDDAAAESDSSTDDDDDFVHPYDQDSLAGPDGDNDGIGIGNRNGNNRNSFFGIGTSNEDDPKWTATTDAEEDPMSMYSEAAAWAADESHDPSKAITNQPGPTSDSASPSTSQSSTLSSAASSMMSSVMSFFGHGQDDAAAAAETGPPPKPVFKDGFVFEPGDVGRVGIVSLADKDKVNDDDDDDDDDKSFKVDHDLRITYSPTSPESDTVAKKKGSTTKPSSRPAVGSFQATQIRPESDNKRR
jgi:hypothetical protein